MTVGKVSNVEIPIWLTNLGTNGERDDLWIFVIVSLVKSIVLPYIVMPAKRATCLQAFVFFIIST